MEPFSRKALEPEWFFSHLISITNATGVGGTLTLKALRDILLQDSRMRYVSAGDIMGEIRAELEMTKAEFDEYAKGRPEFDRLCDERIRRFGKRNYGIGDGRLVHIFIPNAFKVLMTCPTHIRAVRRQRDEGYQHLQVSEVEMLISKRDEANNTRYVKLYPGCLWTTEDFDFTVDTSIETNTPEMVAAKILSSHFEWVKKNKARVRV